MINNSPTLKILPIDRLLLHEQHDDQRAVPLVKRIQSDRVLRNPPVVTPLYDNPDCWVVLDGANRTTALRMMDYPYILAQIVEPDDPALNLSTWNHIVYGLDSGNLLDRIRDIPNLEIWLDKEASVSSDLWCKHYVAQLYMNNGEIYTALSATTNLMRRVDLLNTIVDSYKDQAGTDRTSLQVAESLSELNPGMCGLVVFPRFKLDEILYLTRVGYQLPSGITRFTISRRALRLNYPLTELTGDKPLAESNAALREWIQERVAHQRVRHYEEATVLFDE